MAGTYEIPTEGSPNSTEDPKIKTMLKGMNEKLDSSNDLTSTGISKGFMGRWYPPTVIATEQERENVAFGTLTTADEVKNVVLPENGLIVIGYRAIWKNSVASKGQAAFFIGANQLKIQGSAGAPSVQAVEGAASTALRALSSGPQGISNGVVEAVNFVTTGQVLTSGGSGGLTLVFATAGTYNISVQFKAAEGKVAVKERVLQVGVIGGT
jgi:hypothetical protein